MGELKLAAVFSDNCVLQRGKRIALFGSGREGAVVEAVLAGKVLGTEEQQTARGRAFVRNGRFELSLPSLPEGLEHTLTVTSAGETITYGNIAVGEVWLAGGQSNMELELQNCAEREVLQRPDNPMLRFYYTQKRAYMDEAFFRAEENTGWECFGGPGTKAWSAVAYFFGEKLQRKLQVPVGIIGCNWGGTSASNWIPREALAEDRELQVYLELYDRAVEGKSEEQQLREYEEYVAYQAEFDRKAAALYQEQPDIQWDEVIRIVGENRYPGPQGCSNPYRPGGLYECMLRRVMPYTLKGFLYYQGESDDHLPHLYGKLFGRLIRQWREDWGDDELPFLFVQLPMHRYKQDPDRRNWCLIREAQDLAYRTLRNTGMACAIDQGEFNEIHPKKKSIVGERLYYQALKTVYGMGGDAPEEPRFAWAEPGGKELILHFTGVKGGFSGGLERPETDRPAGTAAGGFEIAGEDGQYVPADRWVSEETAEGTVIRVSSEKVPDPVFVRYLWTNYAADGFLYNGGRIPLAPFRTSRRDGFSLAE